MSISAEQPVPARCRCHTRRIILLVVLAIFLATALGNVALVANLAHTCDQQTRKIPHACPDETVQPVKVSQVPAAETVNILQLGSDSRANSLDLAEGGAASNQRSDAMTWLHIPADRKHLYLMSITRDTWVDIPGIGQAKINAAMAYGGVPLVVQTPEGLVKSRIDHVASVVFEGYKAITDSLGGVQVDVPLDVTRLRGNYTFKTGPQKLNDGQALAFVRQRYAFIDGDCQRVKDQQILLKAMLNGVLAPSVPWL